MNQTEPKFELLTDEADKYLASLDEVQRRPKFAHNGLPKTSGSFSEEEKALALAIFAPEAR